MRACLHFKRDSMHQNIILISGSTNYIISSNGFSITILDKGNLKIKYANLWPSRNYTKPTMAEEFKLSEYKKKIDGL